MPDSDTQPTPTEEPQTPTPALGPSPSEQPSVFETKPTEPAPTPVEPLPTLETSASVEPPSTPTEPQSAPTPPPPSPTPIPQSPSSEPAQPHPRSLLQRAREKIQFRKKVKLEKIVALAAKKRSITNNDIEKLLRVSDATATRYLAELVRQGQLKRFGTTAGIRYEPIP